ncbi:MAG TPA: DNA polymerase III subunit beta [Planctomycetota bacterium]|nr:DNA polymerase III subunit beta [Planctomycetota bacterium]HQB01231.1 DNA polymerase III subunit beta [Planctomycetota bacterium]HRU51951.1 DNA polymerase III subunit beta [Planctomycetota bacterium]
MMKIKCHRQSMIKALQTINHVVVQKDLYPVLEKVRITTSDHGLIFRATDLNISITYTLPLDYVDIYEEGELLLSANKFLSLVREIPEQYISLEQEELNGVILCSDGRFCFLGEDTNKFPEIVKFEETSYLELACTDFQYLIKKTLFATTTEKTRFDLDNVLIDFVSTEKYDKALRFVSTDGKRLVICDRKVNCEGEFPQERLTIPASCLNQIDRVLNSTNPEDIRVAFLENQMLIRTPEMILTSRLSDASFPPYEKVMQKDLPYKTSCVFNYFFSALKRANLMADDRNKIFQMSFSKYSMRLSSRGEGTGEAIIDVPCVFHGEPFDIKFNPNFFLEALRLTERDDIVMLSKDSQSPILLKDGEDFQYLVLPIKLDEAE